MTADPPRSLSHRLTRSGGFEALLVSAAGAVALMASFAAAPGWSGAAGALLAGLMLMIAVIDRRRMIIPNELNALAFIAGLAAAVGADAAPGAAIAQALLRAGLMFALFLAFRAGYRALRGVEGMGLGDVKLAAVAGAWLDWTSLPFVVEIATLSALAVALAARFRGHGFDPKAKLPFGAFFAPAIWICWLLAAWRGG